MPLGVDDALFLLASTTAVAYIKRHELLESGVSLLTKDEAHAQAVTKRLSAHTSNTAVLLRGFDLQEEYRQSLANLRALPPTSSSASAGLVRSGLVLSHLKDDVPVYQVPNVPHRHYNPDKRIPHVSSLLAHTESELAANLFKYSALEIRTLFDQMEKEGLWESVIVVSRGIEAAGAKIKYLTQPCMESGLRTLLEASRSSAAVAYYFTFGIDMLPSDDIVTSLFDVCRFDKRITMELYGVLNTFRSYWTPAVYACCLTACAVFEPSEGLLVYKSYMQRFFPDQTSCGPLSTKQKIQQLLSASPLLRETGIVQAPLAGEPLRYLYHIMVPMVLAHFPEQASGYIADMLLHDPAAAPDVFLKCLAYPSGQHYAEAYLQSRSNSNPDDGTPAARATNVRELMFALYALKPSAMNMNSLLKLAMDSARGLEESAPPSASWADDSVRSLSRDGSPVLASYFNTMPTQSPVDIFILSRTLMEHNASWRLTAQFLTAMIHRKHFFVVPKLAEHVAKQGQWQLACQSMSVYLSNQRNRVTAPELCLCVESAVRAGQWSSALFWLDRAHAKKIPLPSQTYDMALQCSAFCPWEESLRVLASMHQAGGTCHSSGVLQVLNAAAKQGAISNAVRVLSKSRMVKWVP
ncbi:hypothetical protein STCU_01181 [Strigomonas culicis]|uniref:Uncharacterized protein n=1 Tax=Strigomonas culicis TaxID=28005 RepID=S9UHA1_9TRYP|nr:hypothetical protein STCU_05191 [Strigomonas culicis]EPY35238.1 hypothetical protein STCU_01181 [Strigomonas culicis]|eukprot:EPY28318.1 hypothetical protein STCU_05191 [Strigomonas culicis]